MCKKIKHQRRTSPKEIHGNRNRGGNDRSRFSQPIPEVSLEKCQMGATVYPHRSILIKTKFATVGQQRYLAKGAKAIARKIFRHEKR